MDNYSKKRSSYGSQGGRSGGYRGDRSGGYNDRNSSYSNDRGRDRDFGGSRGADKPSFKVVCDDCGKNTTVPFEPTNSKPVYCRDCYENHGGESKPRDNRGERSFDRPRSNFEGKSSGADNGAIEKRLSAIEKKLDMLIEAISEDGDEAEDMDNDDIIEEVENAK